MIYRDQNLSEILGVKVMVYDKQSPNRIDLLSSGLADAVAKSEGFKDINDIPSK